MARIAIVGVGAVGGVMAAWLEKTGVHDVMLCARRSLGNIHVITPEGQLIVRSPVVTEPTLASPVDWVMVATKTYDSAGAGAWLKRLAGHGAPVAILQNGVEHHARFMPFLPSAQIVPIMVDCPAERLTASRTLQRATARMTVQDDVLGRQFAELFTGTTVEVSLTPDFKSAVWRKLCVNAAGVVSGLLLQPAGVMQDEQVGELCRQLVRECIAVGRAEGADLNDSLADSVLAGYRTAPPDSINSLHADRLAGRITEIDARNGVVVRLGRKHGIATPSNQMAVALIEAMTRATKSA